MEKDFWLERWQREETGFHQQDVNPYLRQFWHELYLARNSTVFVPLCGKSRDMQWLRQQDHRVLGVEFSLRAVQAFFQENSQHPQRTSSEKFECYEADEISIWCGDFFDLGKEDLAIVSFIPPAKSRTRHAAPRHRSGSSIPINWQ